LLILIISRGLSIGVQVNLNNILLSPQSPPPSDDNRGNSDDDSHECAHSHEPPVPGGTHRAGIAAGIASARTIGDVAGCRALTGVAASHQ